jgi:1-acyl-sn-glycerol-3-phosphate acyltransferase
MQAIRSALFNAVFYLNLVMFMLVFSPLFFGPRSSALWALKLWARSSIWLLEAIAGTRLEVRGRNNIPQGPAIIAAKHQSLFETFAVLPLLADPAMVFKRELMMIPLFGWFAWKFRMIPVDRGARATALVKLISRADEAVRQGRQVLIFPEGTRRAPGAPPDYKAGAMALYLKLGVPCVPLALNSGLFWPRRKFMRYPGTIIFEFLPAITPGLAKNEFAERLQEALETKSSELLAACVENNRH